MKVLENNNYIEATCSHCKSRLGVHVGDIRYNDIAHNCSTFEAACGACGRTTAVPSALIPKSWLRTICPDDFAH